MDTTEGYTTSKVINFGNKITTELPFEPKFADIYGETIGLLIRTHEVMEEVIPQAKELFVKEDKPIDVYLFNDLVRYYAKEMLHNSGFTVEDDVEEIAEYSFKALVNNGLSGKFNGHLFRILKADHGSVPMPVSGKKKEFYNQHRQLTLPFDDPDSEPSMKLRHNILILWEVDSQYNFLQLRLACPKAVGKTRESLEVYFNEPLPHAAEMIRTKDTAITSSEYSEDIKVTKKESEAVPKWTHDIQ
jgi:hypothetical protein